jgi:hypothetical protein
MAKFVFFLSEINQLIPLAVLLQLITAVYYAAKHCNSTTLVRGGSVHIKALIRSDIIRMDEYSINDDCTLFSEFRKLFLPNTQTNRALPNADLGISKSIVSCSTVCRTFTIHLARVARLHLETCHSDTNYYDFLISVGSKFRTAQKSSYRSDPTFFDRCTLVGLVLFSITQIPDVIPFP